MEEWDTGVSYSVGSLPTAAQLSKEPFPVSSYGNTLTTSSYLQGRASRYTVSTLDGLLAYKKLAELPESHLSSLRVSCQLRTASLQQVQN